MNGLDPQAAKSFVETVSFNADGLIPVIAQDDTTGEILMMAWMNAEALTLTLRNRAGTYFSRSRQKLWVKGEESGNYQEVIAIAQDCDADALVIRVNQQGPACHTGTRSCFSNFVNLGDASSSDDPSVSRDS